MTPPRGSSMTTWHYRCRPELLSPCPPELLIPVSAKTTNTSCISKPGKHCHLVGNCRHKPLRGKGLHGLAKLCARQKGPAVELAGILRGRPRSAFSQFVRAHLGSQKLPQPHARFVQL